MRESAVIVLVPSPPFLSATREILFVSSPIVSVALFALMLLVPPLQAEIAPLVPFRILLVVPPKVILFVPPLTA